MSVFTAREHRRRSCRRHSAQQTFHRHPSYSRLARFGQTTFFGHENKCINVLQSSDGPDETTESVWALGSGHGRPDLPTGARSGRYVPMARCFLLGSAQDNVDFFCGRRPLERRLEWPQMTGTLRPVLSRCVRSRARCGPRQRCVRGGCGSGGRCGWSRACQAAHWGRSICMCACVRACVHVCRLACMHARMLARGRTCIRMHTHPTVCVCE